MQAKEPKCMRACPMSTNCKFFTPQCLGPDQDRPGVRNPDLQAQKRAPLVPRCDAMRYDNNMIQHEMPVLGGPAATDRVIHRGL